MEPLETLLHNHPFSLLLLPLCLGFFFPPFFPPFPHLFSFLKEKGGKGKEKGKREKGKKREGIEKEEEKEVGKEEGKEEREKKGGGGGKREKKRKKKEKGHFFPFQDGERESGDAKGECLACAFDAHWQCIAGLELPPGSWCHLRHCRIRGCPAPRKDDAVLSS